MQLLGGLSYRYLPVIAGRDRDIERLEAYFKQRFWLRGDAAGIDLGVRYVDGTNPLSLAQERILSLGFGLIF